MWIQLNVLVSTMKENFPEMIRVIMALTTMRRKIIQVRLNDVLNVVECIRHHSLKCGPNILKAKRELFICKSPPWTDKGGLILISRCNSYLVITRKTIHKGKDLTPSTFIDDLIYKRGGIIILWIGMIKVTVINTDSNGALFLSHRHDIGHPICHMDNINKSSFMKFLNFPLNGGRFSRVHWTKLLTSGICVRISRNFVHDYTWVNAGHLFIRTCKNILKLLKKMSIELELIRRKSHPNMNIFNDARSNRNVHRHRLANITHVPFQSKFMGHDRHLKWLGWKMRRELLKTSSHDRWARQERGTMLSIIPPCFL